MQRYALVSVALVAGVAVGACTKKHVADQTDAGVASVIAPTEPAEPPEPAHTARVIARVRAAHFVAVTRDALYVDDINIEASAHGADVVRIPLGGGAKSTLVHGFAHVGEIATVADSAFFVGQKDEDGEDALWKIAAGKAATRAGSAYALTDGLLTASGDTLFFALPAVGDGRPSLAMMPAAGGTATRLAPLGTTWWDSTISARGAVVFIFNEYKLQRIDTATKATMSIADVRQGRSIATDGEHVYWTEVGPKAGANEGSVWRAPLAGGAAEQVAENQNRPWAIAVDDDAVYWVNNASHDGTLKKRRKRGHIVRTLVGGLNSATGIALDATNIYFVTAGDGVVGVVNK